MDETWKHWNLKTQIICLSGVWMPLLMSPRSSFSRKPWPDHGLLEPLAIRPISTIASQHSGQSILHSSSWPEACDVPSTHSGPRWDALWLLLWGPHLSSGRCCQAFPVLWLYWFYHLISRFFYLYCLFTFCTTFLLFIIWFEILHSNFHQFCVVISFWYVFIENVFQCLFSLFLQ